MTMNKQTKKSQQSHDFIDSLNDNYKQMKYFFFFAFLFLLFYRNFFCAKFCTLSLVVAE